MALSDKCVATHAEDGRRKRACGMEGRRERLVASAVVLVAAVSLSVNTLQGEFVFDDHPAIQTNADVRYII